MSTNITNLPDIVPPLGAVRVGARCETTTQAPFRYLEGQRHHIERGERPIVVYVDAIQRGDGTVEGGVSRRRRSSSSSTKATPAGIHFSHGRRSWEP